MLAPAKVNLCLRVVGRRDDGYHLLDSLVCFPGAGDCLRAEPAEELMLTLGGRFGAALADEADNLVLRAARLLASRLDRRVGARLHLDKELPPASGIGGGSADAAAALRLLCALWRAPRAARAALPALALSLGADVPVCLASVPARMRGIGEVIEPVALPPVWLVLANPGIAVPTGAVFGALRLEKWSAPLEVPRCADAAELAGWLAGVGNDLEQAATGLYPPIGDTLSAIAATAGCLLARMSGSGATCFGIYASKEKARAAATALPRGWWVWG